LLALCIIYLYSANYYNNANMSPYINLHPPVRITQIAKEHLDKIVAAIKETGRGASGSNYLSNLILNQPIPTGNGHQPPADPCEEKKR
jgi:hypothetical protein